MGEQRHLVVEGPDGSIAIAFNQEVPPPELPPEPPVTRTIIRITGLNFCDKGKMVMSMFFYITIFMLTSFFRIIDVINTILMSITFLLVLSGWPVAMYQLTIHGIISILAFVPLMVIDMWYAAAYQLGLAVLCLYLNFTSKYITSFQLEP